MIGLLREGVNNWVSEQIFERRNEWTSKSVGERKMREQSNEQADVCSYGSEWEKEEVGELMSEDLNWYMSEYVNNLGGRQVQREGESKPVSLMYGHRKWPLIQC